MATLTKKKSGRETYYYAYVRSVKWANGKYISLDTNSKVTARVRKSEVDRNEKDLKNGMDIEWSWKNDWGKVQVIEMTLGNAVKQWLQIKKTNTASETHRRYVISLNNFMNVIGGTSPMSSLNNQHIEDFKGYYSDKHTPHGINANLRGIKAFLIYAKDEALIRSVPKIVMMKTPKSKPKYINERIWNDIMDLVDLSDWYKSVFTMFRATGMRRSEAIMGTIEGNFLIVPSHISKTRRELEIPLEDWQIEILKQIHKAREEHLAGGSKLVTFKNKFTKVFKDACVKVGAYERGKTNLHCLRNTFAVMRYLETKDLYQVCKELHHTSITTTEIYSQFSFQRLEQDFPSLSLNEAKMDKCATTKCATTPPSYANPRLLN